MNKKYQNLKHDFVKRIKGVSALRHLYSRVATFHPNNMETDMFIGQQNVQLDKVTDGTGLLLGNHAQPRFSLLGVA